MVNAAAPRPPRADQDRLERVLDASGLGLWEYDLETGDFRVDARCARNLGYDPGQLDASWETGVAIIHPDDAIRVSRLFEAHLRGETDTLEYETRMLTHARTWTWVAGHGRLVRDAAGRPTHISGTVKNIDAERATQETLAQANARLELLAQQLRHQALHDPLTGLLNRRGFGCELERLLAAARAHAGTHALCYLDLDHFKVVNDSCGHAAGDALLRKLPEVLEPVIRGRGVAARLGGDEFAVLLERCTLEEAARIAHGLRDALRGLRFAWQYRRFALDACVGVVGIDAGSRGAAAVLAAADAACYVARERGPGQVHVSPPRDLAIARRRGELRWVARLRAALVEDRFHLDALAIAPLAGGAATHHELLLRLADAQGRLVAPDAFLPAAARHQLMPQIDQWVVDHALAALGAAARRAPAVRGHRFGINLSGDSLRDPQLLAFIGDALARHGVHGSQLCFELTETAAVANLGAAAELMHGLHALGCELALDDFGTGMSSFAWLKQLPVDLVKIDGGFVRDLPGSAVDEAIVRAVHAVGRQMRIATVAEHVETEATIACLRAIGVDYGQGWAIARPVPLAELPLLRPGGPVTAPAATCPAGRPTARSCRPAT
jgi:diguanylate cyclase (GGDEF)-like protein/PAS domain S-box-containing protein